MKKILILFAILFATTINAQDYNRWAISGEIGNQMVSDKTAVSGEEFTHFGLGVRYNLNEIVGVGITGGYDFTSLSEELFMDDAPQFGPDYDFEYGRVNLEGYLNAFKVVDLYSKNWTVLFHGGTGLSFIKTNGTRFDETSFNNKETVLNLRGGASVLYKISRSLAAYADFSMTSNVNQENKFDGSNRVTNAGMSSNVSNVSVGLTLYLGKKGREHADWYVPNPIEPIVNNVTNVTNNSYPEIKFTQEEFNEYYETYIALLPTSEYVFFDHDKDMLNENDNSAKLSIYKIYSQLKKNPTWKVSILGYASPTSSSSDYNQKLSERRTKALKNKLILAGIDESRIKTGSFGKDLARDDNKVHDIARRVELLITKK